MLSKKKAAKNFKKILDNFEFSGKNGVLNGHLFWKKKFEPDWIDEDFEKTLNILKKTKPMISKKKVVKNFETILNICEEIFYKLWKQFGFELI